MLPSFTLSSSSLRASSRTASRRQLQSARNWVPRPIPSWWTAASGKRFTAQRKRWSSTAVRNMSGGVGRAGNCVGEDRLYALHEVTEKHSGLYFPRPCVWLVTDLQLQHATGRLRHRCAPQPARELPENTHAWGRRDASVGKGRGSVGRHARCTRPTNIHMQNSHLCPRLSDYQPGLGRKQRTIEQGTQSPPLASVCLHRGMYLHVYYTHHIHYTHTHIRVCVYIMHIYLRELEGYCAAKYLLSKYEA